MLALEQLAESDFLALGGGRSHRSDPPVATGLFVIAKRRSSVKIWPQECKVNTSVYRLPAIAAILFHLIRMKVVQQLSNVRPIRPMSC